MQCRPIVLAAFALALPSLALAQPARHDRRRHDNGPRVEVRLSFGTSRVPVRALPSPHVPVVRRVSPGGQLVVLDRRGDYYLVDMGYGRTGWVHCSQLPGYVHRSTVTTVIVAQPLITAVPSSARIQRLDRFEYSRILEWSGDHEQGHLKLVRLSDGTYLADVDAEGLSPRRARVDAAALSEIAAALEAMRAFPDDSFAGDGAHFYTTLSAEGALSDGRPLHFSRRFYDPSASRPARLAGELDAAVARLIERIKAATGGAGIVSTFR